MNKIQIMNLLFVTLSLVSIQCGKFDVNDAPGKKEHIQPPAELLDDYVLPDRVKNKLKMINQNNNQELIRILSDKFKTGYFRADQMEIVKNYIEPEFFCQHKDMSVGKLQVTQDLLGEGSFGKVYKGKFEITNSSGSKEMIDVAVKNIEYSKKWGLLMANEINFLATLNLSPHHISFFGCYYSERTNLKPEDTLDGSKKPIADIQIVTELMDADANKFLHVRNDIFGLSGLKRFKVLIQMAEGIKEMHDKGIIHRDIKPDNFLITTNGKVKVADLGFATFEREFGIKLFVGTPGYIAPEIMNKKPHYRSCDIFSLGMTFLNVIARKPLDFIYFDKKNKSVKESKKLMDLILRMIDQDKDKRPEIDEVVTKLNQIMLAYDPFKIDGYMETIFKEFTDNFVDQKKVDEFKKKEQTDPDHFKEDSLLLFSIKSDSEIFEENQEEELSLKEQKIYNYLKLHNIAAAKIRI